MNRHKTTLLIVDDEELVCRGILRNFKHRFDQVFFATDPNEAEKILQRGEVTSLVCDYHLGESMPKGTELLAKWRRSYPHIKKAVLYSGTDLSKIVWSYGIDSKISKSLPLSCLYKAVAHEEMADEIMA